MAGVEREAQYAEQNQRDPAKGEPADQQAQPLVPEPGGPRAHRDDAEALDVVVVLAPGRQEHTADHQREAHGQECEQIAEHDLPEQRWPVEWQERAHAAERKRGNEPGVEREPGGDRAQAIADRRQVQIADALTGRHGHPPEQPFRAETQRHEPAQEQQDFDQAALVKVGGQGSRGLLEIGGQHGKSGGKRSEVLPDRRDAPAKIALDPGLLGWSGRRRHLVGGPLRLEPFAHGRIVEQFQKLADLRRMVRARRGCRALSQGRSRDDPRQQSEGNDKSPEPTHETGNHVDCSLSFDPPRHYAVLGPAGGLGAERRYGEHRGENRSSAAHIVISPSRPHPQYLLAPSPWQRSRQLRLAGAQVSGLRESRLRVTTSLMRPAHGRSAHRPTAVETQPNVGSERHSGRADTQL